MCDSSLYKNVITYTTDAMLVAKPVFSGDGRITDFCIEYLNPACQEMTKNSLQAGSLFSETFCCFSGTVAWVSLGCELFESGNNPNPSFYSQNLDKWLSANFVKLPDDLLLISFHNINKDKEHEQQLRRQNLRLAALSEELVLSRQNLKNKLENINTLNEKLERLAYNDALTDLPNRISFNNHLAKAIADAKRERTIFALMLIDVDNMKNINDSRGHNAGDAYLISVANQLKLFERDSIRIYRFGGDEFWVMATNLSSKDSMITISDAIQESLDTIDVSISAGVSLYPFDSEDTDELMKFADMAMFDVKKRGKHKCSFFQQIMQDKFLNKLNIETRLSKAMDNDSFQLYFQPQVDISSRKLRGFEALLRWHDDELGWISPEQFIPLAEESHLVIPLGDWVMETACATLERWQSDFNFSGIMSVNVSPIQLRKPTFIYDLGEVVKKYNIKPKNLEIEITEGILIENLEDTVSILQQIKDMGIGISLDDFGTGYSSLSYLQILPLTTLKIDKSFIANITSKTRVEADITDAIISLVTKMGLDTIAEGVENEDQLSILSDLHCRNTQGFLMGKPMPIDLCERMLNGDESAILRIDTGKLPISYSI